LTGVPMNDDNPHHPLKCEKHNDHDPSYAASTCISCLKMVTSLAQ
jgi:hypothetical protein